MRGNESFFAMVACSLVACLLLAGCNEETAAPGCAEPLIELSFPDERDGVVPYKNGGEARVEVRVSRCERLAGPVELRLFEEGKPEPEGGWPKVSIAEPLNVCPEEGAGGAGGAVSSCSEIPRVGSATVKFPRGGSHRVGVVGLGTRVSAGLEMVRPSVRIASEGLEVALRSNQKLAQVCVESSAEAGQVSARWGSEESPTTRTLLPGGCSESEDLLQADAGYRSHARLSETLEAALESVRLAVTLVEAEAEDGEPLQDVATLPLASNSLPPQLDVPDTIVFDKAGEWEAIQLTATIEGRPLPGFAVKIDGPSNEVSLSATSVTTDADGQAEVFFKAPQQTAYLAWSNETYGGLAFTRLEPKEPAAAAVPAYQAVIEARDTEGNPLGADQLPEAGEVFEVVVHLTADGENQIDTDLRVEAIGPSNVVPQNAKTNQEGRARFLLAAPEGGSLGLLWTVDGRQVGVLLMRR